MKKLKTNQKLGWKYALVKGLLYRNRVPVVIKSNPLYAVQIKGGAFERV